MFKYTQITHNLNNNLKETKNILNFFQIKYLLNHLGTLNCKETYIYLNFNLFYFLHYLDIFSNLINILIFNNFVGSVVYQSLRIYLIFSWGFEHKSVKKRIKFIYVMKIK